MVGGEGGREEVGVEEGVLGRDALLRRVDEEPGRVEGKVINLRSNPVKVATAKRLVASSFVRCRRIIHVPAS